MKIYNQPTWGEDTQKILMVEVPDHIQFLNQQDLKMYLEDRYIVLARQAPKDISLFAADLLGILPPFNNPEQIAWAIMGSEQFRLTIEYKDGSEIQNESTQEELREMLEYTTLGDIIRFLSETPPPDWPYWPDNLS